MKIKWRERGRKTVKGLEKTIIERGRRGEHPNQHFALRKKSTGGNDVTSCENASYCATSVCTHLKNMEEMQVA